MKNTDKEFEDWFKAEWGKATDKMKTSGRDLSEMKLKKEEAYYEYDGAGNIKKLPNSEE